MGQGQHLLAACRCCVEACDTAMRALENSARMNSAVQHCIEACRAARRVCLSIEELPFASGFALRLCRLGALVCRACAEDCALHDDAAAKACAAACQRCVEVFHSISVAHLRRTPPARLAPVGRAAQCARLWMRRDA